VKQEAVAIGTEDKRDVHHFRVSKCLLHAGTNTVGIVFRLDDSDRKILFIIKNIIGSSRLGPAHGVSIDKNPAIGNIHLFADVKIMGPS